MAWLKLAFAKNTLTKFSLAEKRKKCIKKEKRGRRGRLNEQFVATSLTVIIIS